MDTLKDFGNIKLVYGEKGGRFPYCNTIFIDDSVQAIIDPGAGLYRLQEINRQNQIQMVFNTHVHFDHIAYNYVFDRAKIMVNELEAIYMKDPREFVRASGTVEALGEEWVEQWLERIARPDSPQSPYTPAYRHEWHLSMGRMDETYRWGDVFDFGHTRMEVIAAPGHTAGFSVMYFPEQGIVYCSDIDLTAFGPLCEDSEQFITSAREVARLDADTFITGHETGYVSGTEFNARLDQYLDVLRLRDKRLLKKLVQPLAFEEIVKMGVFYGPRISEDEFMYIWEWNMDKQHLQRLITQDLVALEKGKYTRC